MNNSILLVAMNEYFHGESISHSHKYDVYIKIINKRKGLFGLSFIYQVNVLLVLYTNEIYFNDIALCVIKRISNIESVKVNKILCNWFVCSEQGSIYLYEALSIKENIKFNNMTNVFTIFNSINGDVSFGPGHYRNKQISEELTNLIEQFNAVEKTIWLNKMFSLFDLCHIIAKKR